MRKNWSRRIRELCPSATLVPAALFVLQAMTTNPAWGHGAGQDNSDGPPGVSWYQNASGVLETVNINGRANTRGAFFQSLGTNGRSCATCHVADQAMTISPLQVRERYERTHGADPLFAPVDGANCPDVRRENRRGHSLLLKHGLIRVAIGIPATAQFTLSVVRDPYGCALVADTQTGLVTASVYRRPLPATNLGFLSTVMWDGRETLAPLSQGAPFLGNLQTDLTDQALSAVKGHAQADRPPTAQQLTDIVRFELGLYSAQVWDNQVGPLNRKGASGGAFRLAEEQYYPGINDVLGADPTGAPFDPVGMTLYIPWSTNARDSLEPDLGHSRASDLGASDRADLRERDRSDIAAGEKLFNTAPLTIANVRGLNDNAALNHPTSFRGTCTSCHDAPNVGNHSLPLPLDIGVGHADLPGLESDPMITRALAELEEPNLPVFIVNGCPDPFNPGQPASFYTTDPGKALVTGQCSDLNRLKGPVLRGLAARAPYFHNGAAATLTEVVNFYDQRFRMSLTQRQKQQLVAFLNSL